MMGGYLSFINPLVLFALFNRFFFSFFLELYFFRNGTKLDKGFGICCVNRTKQNYGHDLLKLNGLKKIVTLVQKFL